MTGTSEAMFAALRAGDVGAGAAVIAADPDAVNARDAGGSSVLLMALYMRQVAFVDLLVKNGVEADAFAAAAMGDVGRLRRLSEVDPSMVASRSPDGWTALHLAAHFGHEEACRALVAMGADVLAWSTNGLRNQALHAAIAGGAEATSIALLEVGADVNAVQHGGFTPLHGAAGHGAATLVEALVRRGANRAALTDDGKDAASLAEEAGHPELAARLRGD